MKMAQTAVYWDSSAILSVILEDRHTTEARRWIGPLLAQKWPLHGPDLWHLAAARGEGLG